MNLAAERIVSIPIQTLLYLLSNPLPSEVVDSNVLGKFKLEYKVNLDKKRYIEWYESTSHVHLLRSPSSDRQIDLFGVRKAARSRGGRR